jgi:branched-chain amino acid transport system ATP-binding protein
MATFLAIEGLRSGYGSIEILHRLSLRIETGEYVAVVGANGAGKTTLLRSISGLVRVREGSISFDGANLRAMPAYKIPPLGIAHVPEGRQVFPGLTVLDNLMAGAWVRRNKGQRQESLELVMSLFPRLKERVKQLAGTLSGGEQQMLAVGRAMMLRPRLMMLDEPSQGLAPKVVGELYERLAQVHASGTTILLVEQNTTAALKYSHRAYVLEHGRIALEGASAELRGRDDVRKAFLGI